MNNGCRQGTEASACQFSLVWALSGLNQFLVFESSWFVRIDPQSFPPLTFVGLIISFAPVGITITFEGQNMSSQTIKKPAVVTGHDDTPGIVLNGFF